MHRKSWAFLALAVLIAALLVWSACSGKQSSAASPGAPAAVPVKVATVAQQDVPVQLRAIGNVEALTNVSVKSMVSGEIIEVHFKEGQDVRKGDLLFTIDPRPFQAALAQAQANLARDKAALKQTEANLVRDTATLTNARAEAQRYVGLAKQGVIAQELADSKQTALESSDATVAADRAAIDNANAAIGADEAAVQNAKINLDYCSIRSPIDGRTGSLAFFKGQVVKANDLPLVTINQITPIYVNFAVPQQYLNEIKAYSAKGKLPVETVIANDVTKPEVGALSFIDNGVDPQTGTIKLKGTFANANRRLWPGQFVDVTMKLSDQPNSIVVPSAAVNSSQAGQYVYVIKADNTVEMRTVSVARTAGDNSVIEKGLQPGERVVTDGQLRLVPGAKIVESKGNTQGTASVPAPGEQRS